MPEISIQALVDAGIVEDPRLTFERPEVKAMIAESAKALADRIDADALDYAYRELYGKR